MKLMTLDGPLLSRKLLAVKLFPLIALCGLAYFAFMLALGNPHAKQLLAKVKRRFAR